MVRGAGGTGRPSVRRTGRGGGRSGGRCGAAIYYEHPRGGRRGGVMNWKEGKEGKEGVEGKQEKEGMDRRIYVYSSYMLHSKVTTTMD